MATYGVPLFKSLSFSRPSFESSRGVERKSTAESRRLGSGARLVRSGTGPRAGFLAGALCFAVLLAAGFRLPAAERVRSAAAAPAARAVDPTPLQDDANLHDVAFLGAHIGWAVGDRGVVWHTRDGGRTWKFVCCPTNCALRSVCFVSDRMGWVAGGETVPYVRVGVGVLLATTDGGRTWVTLDRGRLPSLQYVRFFTPDDGILVGEATSEFPTGVLKTSDGGKTWTAIEGARHSGWRTADFLRPDLGVVAGLDGAVARVAGIMTDPRAGGFGPRGLRDVKLASDGTGWLVGDGGLVLTTGNHGVVWEAPPAPLPEGSAEIFNFHAVAVRGSNVWIGGAPGSVIWHSADGGNTWNALPTGQTAPIERVVFASETLGWAVGAFGSILRTEDGGTSWQNARAGNRRAAILAVNARTDEISFGMLAKETGDMGYRGVALIPFRPDLPRQSAVSPDFDQRLHDAVNSAGGTQEVLGWQFPLAVPGLDRNAEKLRAEWMRRTEGRFQSSFYGSLVCQIRTWRPSVVIIDRPATDDAAGNVLADAVVDAVHQAADPARFAVHRELAALGPWSAARVFARVPGVASGDFVVDAHETLLRLKSTVETAATAAASRLRAVDFDPGSEAYKLVAPARHDVDGVAPRDFFAGLAIAVGSDARRTLPAIEDEFDEGAVRAAQRARDFSAILKNQVRSNTHGAEILATLRSSVAGTPVVAAALRYATLAQVYRQNAHWDLAEATLCELVDRYPSEPPALDAMKWLFQYWTGAELTYQRLRRPAVETHRAQFNSAVIGESIERAIRVAQTDPKNRGSEENISGPDPLTLVTRSGALRASHGNDWLTIRLEQQRALALRMAMLIRSRSPALFRTPEIQFPLAALLRQAGLKSLPKEKGRRAAGAMPAGSETQAEAFPGVDQETQKAVNCRFTAVRPRLDGLLSETCWQEATEVPLSAAGAPLANDGPHALAMFARDAQFLYFAISVPRVAGLPTDGPLSLGRAHDQDLSKYDRVALSFDVDRDFVTSYTVEIDQRGCVAESCWGDPRWNPERMWIKAEGDDRRWRIEGAIAFDELVPRPPQAGEGWGLAVVRTIPAERQESWSGPAVQPPPPESFGLIRFR